MSNGVVCLPRLKFGKIIFLIDARRQMLSFSQFAREWRVALLDNETFTWIKFVAAYINDCDRSATGVGNGDHGVRAVSDWLAGVCVHKLHLLLHGYLHFSPITKEVDDLNNAGGRRH